MTEKNKDGVQTSYADLPVIGDSAPQIIADSAAQDPKAEKNAKERLYDKIPLTARQLDIIIIALIVAFIVFVVVGALVGNGYLPALKF